MKKIIVTIIIILITIICTLLVKEYFFSKDSSYIIFNQTEQNINGNLNELSLKSHNLNINLKNFFTNGINEEELLTQGFTQDEIDNIKKFANNNLYNGIIEISTIDGSEIHEVYYDYLVYDNEKNIIASSIVYDKSLKSNTKFLRSFLNRVYNTDDINVFNEHYISSATSKLNIKDTGNSVISLFTASDNTENNIDLSKLHILIVNPSYKEHGSNNKISLENEVFEYIIEK